MARTLPWERASTLTRLPSSTRRPSSPPARPGPSRRDIDDGDDADDGDGHGRRKKRKHSDVLGASRSATQFRTPSTSPPPAPPAEAYMIEGLEHDDKYRLVEDELLAVAQSFTAHLHAAEYQRLKAKAKQHAAAGPGAGSGLGAGLGAGILPRPVTSAPTDRVQKRSEMASRRAKQRKALKMLGGRANADDDSDDGDAPWAGTSLQSLMEGSPRKAKPALVALSSVLSGNGKGKESQMGQLKYRPLKGSSPLKTATSVGVAETDSGDDDEDDDDDLDGPPATTTTTTTTTQRLPLPARAETSRPQPAAPSKRTVSFAPAAREIPPSPDRDARHQDQSVDQPVDDEQDDEMSDLDGGSLMDKIRRRREQEKAERQRRQQQQRAARRAG